MTENLYATNCIRTRSGKYVNFLEPDPDSFIIEDIAWALSRINRFVGHLSECYSVAQHSVLCSRLVPREHAFTALMHDSSEYATGDCNYYLKNLLPEFRVIEDRLMQALATKFGFTWPLPPQIKEADKQMLELEWDTLMLGQTTFPLEVWTPDRSYSEFMTTYYEFAQ